MLRNRLKRLSLLQQFLLITFAILLGGMLIIGWWVANRIENAVVNQAASTTALYMNNFVPPIIQSFNADGTISAAEQQTIAGILTDTANGNRIVSLKIWDTDQTLIYSPDASQLGVDPGPNEELEAALNGTLVSHLSRLDKAENRLERQVATMLIETYAPIVDPATGAVIAVVETYQDASTLQHQVSLAQRQSWLIVIVGTIAMYGLLSGLMRRGSRTIAQQQSQLQQTVDELHHLLAQNQSLQQRLKAAANRTTQINEQFLRRIGHDLHDGPAQDLALALLRINDLCREQPQQAEIIRHALESALAEIRHLAAGLQLPELKTLPTSEVAYKAVREFRRKTECAVDFEIADDLPEVSPYTKIAIYRIITEALYNSFRHAKGAGLRGCIVATHARRNVHIQIVDDGPGFDPAMVDANNGHLGLAGLKDRVTLLDGVFKITSEMQRGTRIDVMLPVDGHDGGHDE